MTLDRIDRNFQRIVLILIFCETHREWGALGQIVMLLLCFAYAFYADWAMSRPVAPADTKAIENADASQSFRGADLSGKIEP
jgi:hypothetical protein